MLTLGKYVFEEDLDNSSLTLYIGDMKSGSDWNIDCVFLASEYEGETVSPEIIINNIHTKKYDVKGFAGEKFSTRNIGESERREDSLYLFEHEPFIKMKVKILAVDGGQAHITCKGTAVEDGYASPVKTIKFAWDCWLPLIVKSPVISGDREELQGKSENGKIVKINGFGQAKTEDLNRYEEETGYIFPEDYKEFLLNYNGGYPERKDNYINTHLFYPRQRIAYFYGITKVDVLDETALLPKYNLFSMYAKYQNTFDMENMIFVAAVYGQYHFCLCTGEEMSGIYYFDSAEGEKRIFHKFCNTFTDFLNLMVTDERQVSVKRQSME